MKHYLLPEAPRTTIRNRMLREKEGRYKGVGLIPNTESPRRDKLMIKIKIMIA